MKPCAFLQGCHQQALFAAEDYTGSEASKSSIVSIGGGYSRMQELRYSSRHHQNLRNSFSAAASPAERIKQNHSLG